MVMNIIMIVSMYPTMLILYFVYKYMGLESTKYIFGVTLTGSLKKSERIEEIRKEYNKHMRIVFLTTFFIPLIAFFTEYISIQFTIWITWMFIEIVAFMVPYAVANEKVMSYKNENKMQDEEEAVVIEYVELRDVRTVHVRDFILQIVFSVIPVTILFTFGNFKELTEFQIEQLKVYQYSMFTFAICTICLAVVAFVMDRRRTIVINGDSDVNINYSRAKKMVWKKIWLYTSILNTLVIIGVSAAALLEFHAYLIFMVSAIVESILSILVVYKGATELGRINESYESKFEIKTEKDDDHYWKWGLIYNNKNDKRTSVESRYGIGTTANMAKTSGKLGILLVILSVVWIPFLCGYMIVEDFTPISVSVENQKIICEHTKVYYSIPLHSIEKIELLKELPKHRSKSSGTATDTLEKGNFAIEEYGKVKEFINPENNLFIYIQTDDEKYIISGYSDDETMSVYEGIRDDR